MDCSTDDAFRNMKFKVLDELMSSQYIYIYMYMYVSYHNIMRNKNDALHNLFVFLQN
jgi:hypothetical protein